MLSPPFKKLPKAMFSPKRSPKNRDQAVKLNYTEKEFSFIFEPLFQHLLNVLSLR